MSQERKEVQTNEQRNPYAINHVVIDLDDSEKESERPAPAEVTKSTAESTLVNVMVNLYS